MGPPFRSKKIAVCGPPAPVAAATGHISGKWSASRPWQIEFPAGSTRAPGRIGRCGAGCGWAASPLLAPWPSRSPAGANRQAGTTGPGKPDGLLWTPSGAAADHAGRFRRGDSLELTFDNELPVPALLNWHGLDGIPAVEPLAGRVPLRAGLKQNLLIPLLHAGPSSATCGFSATVRHGRRGRWRWSSAESGAVAVDRDEVLLLEDWRLRPDGTADRTGQRSRGCQPLYTINGETSRDITVHSHERLRLRFINGFQRNVVALKMEASISGSWPSTASRPNRSWHATARWCWRPAPGSTPSSTQPLRRARRGDSAA